MARTILAASAGFLAWLILWIGAEKILGSIWPDTLGAHQRAFEAAIVNGGPFTADTTLLLTHIGLGVMVSATAGFVAALSAGKNKRAPLALAFLLLALGLMKAAMSWPYVPIWYHIIFTSMLAPLAIIGGKLHHPRRAD